MKLGQNVCLHEILESLEIIHVGSKTRSLVEILKNLCLCSRGHIFSPILMKHGKNICFDEFLEEFENGSCGSKTSHKVRS